MKTLLLNALATMTTLLAVISVNSCCMLVFGQLEEPVNLKRLKKF